MRWIVTPDFVDIQHVCGARKACRTPCRVLWLPRVPTSGFTETYLDAPTKAFARG